MTASPSTTTAADSVSPDFGGLVQAGSEALEAGDLRAALERFEQVVEAFPDQPQGYNNLGALFSSLGELERAEASFGHVIELMPENPHVRYNRGVVRSRREDYAGAREDFEVALKLAPDDPDIHNNLGVTAYLEGRAQVARAHFERALELRPDYDNAMLNLCDLVADTAGTGAAIVACEDHLSRQASSVIRHKLFDLCGRAGREVLEKASRIGDALLAADPADTQVRLELGRLLQARTALGEAAQDQATG